ncbi:hypothetical protein JQK15_03965 [Sphingobium sp. BHU LFT2]|uniref:hypothetical protein n=1 Tax=Sphingobium sp. BHU LFT2 TaxID=2807634 RepID=UPI001BE89651|nr:hypothetical protein [Sphingobium sp. BHU LFT2]MBT2242685.1 hypothetical protein [Sphingobium sp. BHU LFT2]
MSTTKKAKVLRDFRDAGTERSFKADEIVDDLTAGEFTNYAAGGLVEEVTSTAKPTDDAKKGDEPKKA